MNSIQKIIEKFFHTIKYKYMSLNVEVALHIKEGNGHVLSYSVFNTVLFWNCLSNIDAQTLMLPKSLFSLN